MSRQIAIALALLLIAPLAFVVLRSPTVSATAELAVIRRVYLPAVLCDGCAGSERPTPAPSPELPDAREARVIELVNQARLAIGCPVATVSPFLMQATGDWSEYMWQTEDYSHGTPEQRVMKYWGYPGGVLENIAGGSSDPDDVFFAWMISPAHRSNIEKCTLPGDPSYNPAQVYEIGVGYAEGYWTLAIADRDPSGQAAAP